MTYVEVKDDQVSPDGPGHVPVVFAKTPRMLPAESPEVVNALLAWFLAGRAAGQPPSA